MSKSYSQIGTEIGELVEQKQKAYGDSITKAFDLVKVFIRDYRNEDGTYTIPESLLKHLLLQVRIIDKQNRIFSNPDQDLMGESPYSDIAGYSIIGTKESNKTNKKQDEFVQCVERGLENFTYGYVYKVIRYEDNGRLIVLINDDGIEHIIGGEYFKKAR